MGIKKDFVKYPVSGEGSLHAEGTITELYIFGWDERNNRVKSTKVSAVKSKNNVYRVELHDKKGCISFAYINASGLGRFNNLQKAKCNKGKEWEITEHNYIYGKYPTIYRSDRENDYIKHIK